MSKEKHDFFSCFPVFLFFGPAKVIKTVFFLAWRVFFLPLRHDDGGDRVTRPLSFLVSSPYAVFFRFSSSFSRSLRASLTPLATCTPNSIQSISVSSVLALILRSP